ncbi:hypothetical protein N7523_005701 [Penicillium sp. IBT 18751x]|nr:hypothetical protein N7523_005701 [Penicillium sp. IBT 18751x]
MLPIKLDDTTTKEVKNLALWVRQAKIKADKLKKNKVMCVDEARETNVRPLLDMLGYTNIPGHLASVQRITGESSIDNPRGDHLLLVFPLSVEAEPKSIGSGNEHIAGKTFKPGTYIKLTKTLELEARLDFLLVSLPEGM